MMNSSIRMATATAVGAAAALGALGFTTPASAETAPANSGVTVPAGYTATVFAHGGANVSSPDDIAQLRDNVFVAYQNGVGTKGEPSATGQKASTVVEYTKNGKEVAHWNLTGRVDGMAADAHHHEIIATVNTAGSSSIYTIAADGEGNEQDKVKHYEYSSLSHGGGTGAVTVHDGNVYVTATDPSSFHQVAMYSVTFSGHTAVTTPLFKSDFTLPNPANGKPTPYSFNDPQFATYVPSTVPSFGGDLMLNSPTQQYAFFIKNPGQANQSATQYIVFDAIDNSAFATAASGTLYVVDNGSNDVVAITGHFTPGQEFGTRTTGGWGFTTTGLVTVDTKTLANIGITHNFGSGLKDPKGLLFAPAEHSDGNEG
jgi:hypothetical protein